MNKELVMEMANKKLRKGKKTWGAIKHLLYYGAITIRELNVAPFYSNGSNKVIQRVKKFFENNELGVKLNYEWTTNPETKSRFKEFFLEEVA